MEQSLLQGIRQITMATLEQKLAAIDRLIEAEKKATQLLHELRFAVEAETKDLMIDQYTKVDQFPGGYGTRYMVVDHKGTRKHLFEGTLSKCKQYCERRNLTYIIRSLKTN